MIIMSVVPKTTKSEICTALELTVTGGDTTAAVTKYNGIYMKQTSLVNGRDWWKQRYTTQCLT